MAIHTQNQEKAIGRKFLPNCLGPPVASATPCCAQCKLSPSLGRAPDGPILIIGNVPARSGRQFFMLLIRFNAISLWRRLDLVHAPKSWLHGRKKLTIDCFLLKWLRHRYLKLNHYMGSGGNKKSLNGNKKLPLRRFPTVGIVRKVPSTINKTQQQTSPQWWAVCPPCGMCSMNCPNLTWVAIWRGWPMAITLRFN